MSDAPPKPGKYRLGSAFIWAAGLCGVAYFTEKGSYLASGFGGLIAGWGTASILGRLAKWNMNAKGLMVVGVLVGVILASGAVAGLHKAISSLRADKVEFDWGQLVAFVLSGAAAPAAVLGLLTGLYVRNKIPRPESKA